MKSSLLFKNEIRSSYFVRIGKNVNLVAMSNSLSGGIEQIAIIVTTFTAYRIDTWLILNRMENAHPGNSFNLSGIVSSFQSV